MPRKRGPRPEAWAFASGQGPVRQRRRWGHCSAASSSGAGLGLPPLQAEGSGDMCISRPESLAAVPMSHFIRLGSAPGTRERAEEAGGCLASSGTGVGWFVSPGLTLQPKDYFPQAVTRRADTCCPFIWEVLIFANRDARISGREGFANLFSAPGDGVQCFLPQCPHLTPHLLLLRSSLPWCLLAERGFACAVWCVARRQAALCRRACGVNRRACGVNWHPSVQLLRG